MASGNQAGPPLKRLCAVSKKTNANGIDSYFRRTVSASSVVKAESSRIAKPASVTWTSSSSKGKPL